MRSMTGFGLGEAPLGAGRILLEARSLNHRFVDMRVTLPTELTAHGLFVEQVARSRLRRGRFSITVRFVCAAETAGELDLARARCVYRSLLRLRDELAPGTELPLTALAAVPDLFATSSDLDPEEARQALQAALNVALDALDELRVREGQALARDLRDHLRRARELCVTIGVRAPEIVVAVRARLRERVALLLADTDVGLDASRLEQEVAMLADRADVAEELARLESHFDQFDHLLDAEEPVGRTLDFLLQEMAREANTIGAKSQDAPLVQRVVELKALLERLREQVQNVE
jgi:uncharacterized protein (TIGR00255 family)